MPDDDRHVMAWLRINRALARAIRKKSLDSAKAANLAQRCVKVTNAPDGRFVRPTGERTHVERLPFCRWWITGGGSGSSNVWEYSCPVAISLLLRFLLECCMVLLLMLCVSIPQMLSNITRSQVRDSCRQELITLLASHPMPAAGSDGATSCTGGRRMLQQGQKKPGQQARAGGSAGTAPTSMLAGTPNGTTGGTRTGGGDGGGGGGSSGGGGGGGRGCTLAGNRPPPSISFDINSPCGYSTIPLREDIDRQPWWLWPTVRLNAK